MPTDYLQDLDDQSKANKFINDATTPSTAEISKTQVASQIYLAYKIREGAKASEKYAKGLNLATWALVGVTVLLAIVQAVAIFRGCP